MVVSGCKTMEDLVHRTVESVKANNKLSVDEKKWLLAILDILKSGGYARVLADGCLIDIERIADTHTFASFFDVYNHLYKFETKVMPVRINKLVNRYENLLDRELW